MTSCSTKCYFQASIMCTDSSNVNEPTVTWDSGTTPTITYKYNTASTSQYINLTTQTLVGDYKINFKYSFLFSYDIQSSCKTTPTSISITPIEPLSYNFLDDSYTTIVSITGLDSTFGPVKEFDLTCPLFIKCTLKYEQLRYRLRFYGAPTSYASLWSFKVCLGSTQRDFTIASPINAINFTYSDISYYVPDKAMGKFIYPQYSFNVESNQNIPPYLILKNNAESLPLSKPYPIKSINGISTYMGSFIYPENYVNTTFTLNAQTLDIELKPTSSLVYIKSSVTSLKSANNPLSIFTVSSTETDVYGPIPLYYGLNYGNKKVINSPFSTINGDNNQLQQAFSFLIFKSSASLFQEKISYNTVQLNINNAKETSASPTIIEALSAKSLANDNQLIITIQFTCPNGLLFISTQRIINEMTVLDEVFYYHQDFNIISGDYKSGTVELLYNYKYTDNSTNETNLKDKMKFNIILYDLSLNSIRLTKGEYFSISPNKYLSFPTGFDLNSNFATSDIKSVSFLFNNIDLTNNSGYNIMYIKLSGQVQSLKLTIKPQFEVFEIFGTWNQTSLAYQFIFYLPGNIMPGVLSYSLSLPTSNYIFNTQLPSAYQLNIISNNTDLSGPIFKSITKIPYSEGTKEIGWKVTIEDLTNGYKDGFVIITSSVDNKIYNISITPPIILYSFDYYIKVILPTDIITQDYFISQVVFYDNQGVNSTYESNSFNDFYQYTNPFINYVTDNKINVISVTGRKATVSPTSKLVEITVSPNELIFGKDNFVSIKLSLDNPNFLISKPVVYLTSSNIEIIECKTEQETSANKTHSFFVCNKVIASGFGYPLGFGLSVHNIYSSDGNINGYASDILKENNLQYHIPYGITYQEVPSISRKSAFSSEGGALYLYGKSLTKCTAFQVEGFSPVLNIPVYNSQVSISLEGTFSSPFNITCVYNGGSTFTTVNPIITKYYTDPIISSESSEELPTNEPQKCLNNCGGQLNGYCSSKGCVCYSPYIGEDCSSQVIVVTPDINGTTPVVTFPNITDPGNINPNNTDITKSLINIVELREIDIFGKIVKAYPLNVWIAKQSSKYVYQYQASIESDGFITSITTQVEWFDRDTNLTFANQKVKIVKSSVKYTIDITFYKFISQLNSLQLVMKASLNSTQSNNVCSTKQFGQTVDDNSDYIKLSIQNISLYGRFVKRAIVDGTPRSCSNILLDNSMNLIQKQSNSSQTYIGIQIPYFRNNVKIDPDFSVLIDSDNKNNKGNKDSVCKYSDSGEPIENSDNSNGGEEKGLSKTKIAGIVIGSVAFVVAALFAGGYSIYRKKKIAKQMAPINVKLTKVNNSSSNMDNNNYLKPCIH
ncbi:hypothetical protein DICPUDRAFT_152166 [Dictyostelium purpureum]|uniref:EGF-like domain-containing protein n=1 Tax=Dictyostelium purpureum TaxID=5786 RepID=F0ZKM5_DICPU|nr:uncharacterized protein DICPUDRAFT_152166 [Dictyostelium purpureum]EGC35504.1 hypothetical protein DICPUDRAFT_152166 [Dictyostelium purpureum]|eukprot:XP_003287983.1 hypothetical protein DICPUDRAFT_152166 [Dictyostelium purpureum]